MNKSTLVEFLREETYMLKADAENVIELIFDFINSIPEGESLELRNFGTFSRKVSNNTGKVNPHTGEKVADTTFSTIRFKPSKTLRK